MNVAARIQRIVEHRGVLWTLVKRDLRVRYARSILGYLWTLVEPLCMILVYAFVFATLFKRPGVGGVPFVMFLVGGVLAWNWFNSTLTESARALSSERLLVRSTNLPREIWVLRMVMSKGIEFLLSMPIMLGFLIYFRFIAEDPINLHWQGFLMWIPALLMEFLLLVGMGLVMAPVTALVDDAVRIVRIALRMLFYLTPILYPMKLVAERAPWAHKIQQVNPLTAIIDMYRGAYLPTTPDYRAWIFGTIVTIFWVFFGMWVFRKLEPAVLKEI